MHHLGDNVCYGQTSTRILSSLYDVAFGKWVVELFSFLFSVELVWWIIVCKHDCQLDDLVAYNSARN